MHIDIYVRRVEQGDKGLADRCVSSTAPFLSLLFFACSEFRPLACSSVCLIGGRGDVAESVRPILLPLAERATPF